MALKANRVGVAPTEVDSLGRIKSSSSDTYTKSEVDTLLNNKVSNSHLKANGKNFYFAYDAESDSYGYKLNGQGDFIPFNSGSSATLGINVLEPLTGTFFLSNVSVLDGGYQVDTDGVVYVNAKLKAIENITNAKFTETTNSVIGVTKKIKFYKSSIPDSVINDSFNEVLRANGTIDSNTEFTIAMILQ